MLKHFPIYLSRALSMALHPLVLPLYFVAMLFTQTSFSLFPVAFKWYLGLTVVICATLVPILTVAVLYKIGWLSDLGLHDRKTRLLPLLVGAIACMVGALLIAQGPMADFLRKFMVAMACCELFCWVVSIEWKISLHLTGMGAAVALMVVMNTLGLTHLFWPMVWTILASGVLASARLYLGYHNPQQIAAGFVGGLLITWVVLLWM